jgi:hypothetical protein
MSNNEIQETKPGLLLTWTSHPFKEFPISSTILFAFIAIIAFSLWRIAVIDWEMPLFYYLGVGIFVLSFTPYFIATTYEFYDDKIVIHYWIIKVEKPYSNYGCYYFDKKGVMLSTFKMPRRLDPFRGLNIRLTKSQEEKEKLLEILEEKIGNKA